MTTPPLSRILLVEDDPDIQAVARLALEAVGGFTVEICSSGSEAINNAPLLSPDLIILDAMMPNMDGIATFKELKKLPQIANTPVIFMTAKVQMHEVLEYKKQGAVDVIPKPFNPMTLAQVVREIWERFNKGQR